MKLSEITSKDIGRVLRPAKFPNGIRIKVIESNEREVITESQSIITLPDGKRLRGAQIIYPRSENAGEWVFDEKVPWIKQILNFLKG